MLFSVLLKEVSATCAAGACTDACVGLVVGFELLEVVERVKDAARLSAAAVRVEVHVTQRLHRAQVPGATNTHAPSDNEEVRTTGT